MDNQYDIIIIGTDAGGGTLLHTLSESGKTILVLERGSGKANLGLKDFDISQTGAPGEKVK